MEGVPARPSIYGGARRLPVPGNLYQKTQIEGKIKGIIRRRIVYEQYMEFGTWEDFPSTLK
jgi:hypothetical protein